MRGTVNLISRTIALSVVFMIGFMTLAGFMVGGGYLTYTKVSIEALQELGVDVPTEEYFDDSGAVYVPQMTLQNLVAEIQLLHSMKDTVSITMLVERYGLKIEDDLSPYVGQKYRDMPLVKLLSQETLDDILDTTMVGDLYGYDKEPNPEYIEGDDEGYPYYWYEDGVLLGGMSGIVACYTVRELMDLSPDSLVGSIHIYEALNLTSHEDMNAYIVDGEDRIPVSLDEPITVWTDSSGTSVNGILSAIAPFKITDVEHELNDITIADISAMVSYDGKWYSWQHDSATHDILLTEKNDITAELADLTIDAISGDRLSDEINEMQVSSLLGYTKGDDGKWYNSSNNEVDGMMAAVAGFKVGELDEKIGTVKMGDVAGYTYNEQDAVWYKDGAPATGILASLSDLTIDEMSDEDRLSGKIQTISIADVMGYQKNSDGVWCSKNGDGELVEVSGIMKVLADSSLNDAESTIDNSKMADILGYKEKLDADGNPVKDSAGNAIYVDENGDDVHVLMQKIARTNFSELDGITDTLTIADLIPEEDRSEGYISLLDDAKTLDELPAEIDAKFQSTPIFDFIDAGVIEFETEEERDRVMDAFGPGGSFDGMTIPMLLLAIS